MCEESRTDLSSWCLVGVQPCRQMQRNATARGIEQSGRRTGASRSATPPTRGRHLAAAPSGPGAKTAAAGHPITIGNKKRARARTHIHTHTRRAGTGTRRFFTRKIPSDLGVNGKTFRLDKARRGIAGRPRRFRIFAWVGCAGRTAEYSGGGAGTAAAASGGTRGRAGDAAKMFERR